MKRNNINKPSVVSRKDKQDKAFNFFAIMLCQSARENICPGIMVFLPVGDATSSLPKLHSAKAFMTL